MAVSRPQFYPTLPKVNVPFNRQLTEWRQDFDALEAIVRSSYQDGDLPDGALTGLAFGRADGTGKRRFRHYFYSFGEDEGSSFNTQRNIGSDSAEDWTNIIELRSSDGAIRITSPRFNISFGGVVNATSFYAETGGVVGPQGPQGDTGPTGAVGPEGPANFYGIIFKETEAGGALVRNDLFKLDSEFFYLSSSSTDKKPIISLHNAPGGDVTGASNLAGDEGVFAQKTGTTLEFKSITAGNGVILSSDANAITITAPGNKFYGITVGQTDDLAVFSNVNKINFNVVDFYVNQNDPNTDEVIVNFRHDVPALETKLQDNIDAKPDFSDIPPGFYGLIVENAQGASGAIVDIVSGINKIRFNHPTFPIQVSGENGVFIGFSEEAIDHGGLQNLELDTHEQYLLADGSRDLAGEWSADSNKITNLGAPVAGSDAARLSDVTDQAGAAGPGFYGIIVKHSDDTQSYSGIEVLTYNVTDFYVSQNSPNTDEVIVNFRHDESRYLLASGSRSLTGDWDNTGRRIRNTGVAEVTDSAPPTTTGVIWLDTAATGTSTTGTLTVNTVTSNTVLDTSNTVVLCNAASGSITITLPTAVGNDGKRYFIKKIDSSGNSVTIDGDGSETIDDALTQILSSQYDSIELVSDGTEWWII